MSILSAIFETDRLLKSSYSSFSELESKLLELNEAVKATSISQRDAMNEVILAKHLAGRYIAISENITEYNRSWNQGLYIQARNAVMDYCYKNKLYSLLPFTQLCIRGLKDVLTERVERFLESSHSADKFQEDIQFDIFNLLSKDSASDIIKESKKLDSFSRYVSLDVIIESPSASIYFQLSTPYMHWHQIDDLVSFFNGYAYMPKSIKLDS